MALQINRSLTTRSGFAVPSGSYCWLQEERAKDFKFSVQVDLVFFKDKASFDQAFKERIFPVEVSVFNYRQEFTAQDYANLTAITVHNYVKAQLEAALGVGTVSIVQ